MVALGSREKALDGEHSRVGAFGDQGMAARGALCVADVAGLVDMVDARSARLVDPRLGLVALDTAATATTSATAAAAAAVATAAVNLDTVDVRKIGDGEVHEWGNASSI